MGELSEAIRKVLEVLGIIEADVLAKLEAIRAMHVESSAALLAFEAWIVDKMSGQVTPAAATALAAQVWAELMSGAPGVNPHAGGVA